MSTCLLVYLSTCLLAYLPTCLLVYLPTCLLAYLPLQQQIDSDADQDQRLGVAGDFEELLTEAAAQQGKADHADDATGDQGPPLEALLGQQRQQAD